ncbi:MULTISPECIES: YtxH domain-containing protein [unclassified Streptomyces]|uniref:YtxH domain-containing protein n=1 Tax=unclassified Streptomyces TaxID=2593676 RepID=UPI0033196044
MRYKVTFLAGVALGYVLGAAAGRERYEQMKKSAQRVAQNPVVRNAAETAGQGGRVFAVRTFTVVGEKAGDVLPNSVVRRVPGLRRRGQGFEDEWGTSNT